MSEKRDKAKILATSFEMIFAAIDGALLLVEFKVSLYSEIRCCTTTS